LLDLIDLMQQAGVQVLPPSRGLDGVYPPPRADDGVLLDTQNAEVSRHSLEHIRKFIFDGLNKFDQSDLESMGMAGFFHPEVKWYGPGGIGACLTFSEFETFHQRPWLNAFPDRSVQDLTALIAEGNYSGAPGWAGVRATHTGEYLGYPATGNRIEFNGLDFWKREGEMYVENWVFVDMIHLFRQLGVDLIERMRQLSAAQSASGKTRKNLK
jgi:predicted ester cyclase